MMRAITTKYFGYTNRISSRVKATASARESYSDGTVYPERALTREYEYDQGLSTEQNHCRAAKALAEKLNWHGLWVAGGLPDNSGNCYVRLPDLCAVEQLRTFGIEGMDWFIVAEKFNG